MPVALGIEHVRIAPGTTTSTSLEFISYPYSHSLLTLALFGLGVWIYALATKARDGMPPPSLTALWVMALTLGALTIRLAWLADHHRRPRR